MCIVVCCILFFFTQKTAYEMRISDWSSDVCSSDLRYGRQCLTEEIAMGRSGVAHELSGQDQGVLGKPRNQSGLLFSSDQMLQGSCISFSHKIGLNVVDNVRECVDRAR